MLARTLRLGAALLLMLGAFNGCESTDGSSTQVSGGVYYGAGFYDPWYHGDIDYPPDIIVTPPDRPVEPPHPAHPIATPPSAPVATPRAMPSIPSTPRPSFRR